MTQFTFAQRTNKTINLKIRIIKNMTLYVVIKIVHITKTVTLILIKYGSNTEYEAFMSRYIDKHIHIHQTEYLEDKIHKK